MKTYLADPATTPWNDGETEGVTFRCQVLLSGDDRGPEAIRFQLDARPSVYAHMHLTAQFQLLLGGTMDFPRNAVKLRPPGVHYTDHNTPYGPFSVGDGHDVLVLHPKQGGLMTMGDRAARREINLSGRVLVGMASETEWVSVPGHHGVRYKALIPYAFGPEVTIVECRPGVLIPTGPAPYGRYEVVSQGSVEVDGQMLTAPGLRYFEGDGSPTVLQAGPEGATMIFLCFDADALEGGLTGEGIAITAAQAMARAI